MELFQVNEALAALENALPLQHGDAWLEASVNLAWYLRQRDCERALTLADEVDEGVVRELLAGHRGAPEFVIISEDLEKEEDR